MTHKIDFSVEHLTVEELEARIKALRGFQGLVMIGSNYVDKLRSVIMTDDVAESLRLLDEYCILDGNVIVSVTPLIPKDNEQEEETSQE